MNAESEDEEGEGEGDEAKKGKAGEEEQAENGASGSSKKDKKKKRGHSHFPVSLLTVERRQLTLARVAEKGIISSYEIRKYIRTRDIAHHTLHTIYRTRAHRIDNR